MGTVTTGERARQALDAGAHFIVTPNVQGEVAELASASQTSNLPSSRLRKNSSRVVPSRYSAVRMVAVVSGQITSGTLAVSRSREVSRSRSMKRASWR